MTALGWIAAAEARLRLPRRLARATPGRRRRVHLAVEALEPIALLAMTCPTISGFVFLDENPTNPALTNNGLFDPGEAPIPGAQVELLDSSNLLVATTTTGSTGAYSFGGMSTDTNTPVTITQTVMVGNPAMPNIPTNITNQPFTPALQLFNPSLGTLQSVQISSDVVYNSTITIQNLSQITPATGITATLGGTYQITGLGPSLTISGTPMKSATAPDLPPWNGQPGQEPTDTVNLAVEDKQNPALTSPQDLAFYTAQPGKSTITPLITATGSGSASASNGNGSVSQSTFVATAMTVTYTYLPNASGCLINPGKYTIEQVPTPPNLIDGKASENGVVFPNPGSPQKLAVMVNTTSDNLINNDFGKLTAANPVPGPIVRIGVHHQQTRLIVPFTGAVNPVLASDPNNYTVIVSPTVHVPIVSAKFNPITNSVTLTTAKRLNFRYHYVLSFYLPGFSSQKQLVNISFGGKQSLGGFLTENHKRFVTVAHGHIVHA
jgi:hypothetical protein